jgi:hypothetical protein
VQGRIASVNAHGIDLKSDHVRDDPEAYVADVIDAMGHKQIAEGKIQDEYREWKRADGTRPFAGLVAVEKGAGSRQAGLDALEAMLLSTRAREQPESAWWAKNGYSEGHREACARGPALYVSPRCEHFVDELVAMRYDARRDGDPTREQPETTLDSVDHLVDCARYAVAAARDSMREWWRPEAARPKPGPLLARG